MCETWSTLAMRPENTPAATGAYIHRERAAVSSAESHDVDRERALWGRLEQVQRRVAWKFGAERRATTRRWPAG